MRKLVFTNGIFDVIHRGHVELLKACRGFSSDTWVIVGLNSDSSTKRLKGDSRPINNEEDRRAVLQAFSYVDDVIIFNEDTPTYLIEAIRPDVIIKGGDYKAEEVAGGHICPVHLFKCVDFKNGKKYSTTDILERGARIPNITA